jgi:hypothetical protein
LRPIALLLLLLVAAEAEAKKPKKKAEEAAAPAPAAQALPADAVAVPCGFTPGEVVRYRIQHTDRSSSPVEPTSTRQNRYDAVFSVVSHDAATTVFDLKYEDHAFVTPPADPILAEMMIQLADAVGDESFRISVDHATKQQKILNPDALARVGEASAAALGQAIRTRMAGAPPEVVDQTVAALVAMVNNPVMLEQGFQEDTQPVFAFACSIYRAGQTPYETMLPNPFGGPPFATAGVLTVTPTKAGGFTFADNASVPAVDVVGIMGPMLAQAGIPVPAELDATFANVGLETTLELDGARAWPASFSSRRISRLAGAESETSLVATRVD